MSNDMYNTMTEIESPRIYRFGYVFKKNKKKQNKLWVAVNLSRDYILSDFSILIS
jgi:predicted nucleic acid-binding Zn finger protein